MIIWVAERALAARNVARAIVATDDERILNAVKAAGYEAVMTRADHASGTDRIAEVAASVPEADIIVNVQGDEPLISPATIERAVDAMAGRGEAGRGKEGKRGTGEQEKRGTGEGGTGQGEGTSDDEIGDEISDEVGDENGEVGIVTTWEPIEAVADVLNPDVVKIVVDEFERAIYFSRLPVPYPRDAVRQHGSLEAAMLEEPALLTSFRKHTGLYVYRRDVLLAFAKWPQSELERLESLEQLRALVHGVRIKAIRASTTSIGVDTSADLERVRNVIGEASLAEIVSGSS